MALLYPNRNKEKEKKLNLKFFILEKKRKNFYMFELLYSQKFSREENFVVHKNREIFAIFAKFRGSCIRANFTGI